MERVIFKSNPCTTLIKSHSQNIGFTGNKPKQTNTSHESKFPELHHETKEFL